MRFPRPSVALPAALAPLLCAACLAAAPSVAAPSLSWVARVPIGGAGAPSAISCASIALCVAVDTNGDALLSTDPGAGSGSSWSTAKIDEGRALDAVSCASVALCVAVDAEGDALLSTDPNAGADSSWRTVEIDKGRALSSVSCPSATLCVAVDAKGEALVSGDPGAGASATWSPAQIDTGNALTGVSCSSSTLCVAVDAAGNVLASGDPLTGGASSWHAHGIDLNPPLASVSCAASGLCVAVDGAGNAFASANPAAERPTWSDTAIDAPFDVLAAVSCAASGLCVTVDHAGHAFASDTPTSAPASWPEALIDPTAGLVGVSCVSEGLCAAVDASGYALIARVPAPAVTTAAPSEVTQSSAQLNGSVDSYDAALGECRFEYGPTTAYGTSVPCANAPAASDSAQPVSASLPELLAGASYHYRLVASTASGTVEGLDAAFATQPIPQPHPSIGGTPAVGQRLTCKAGFSASGYTLGYAWLRDQQAIGGAGGASYLVAGADTSHHLQCRVTATSAAGSASATSAFVTVPAGGLGAVSETTVGAPRAGRGAVSVPLTCSRQAAGSCTIALRLTVVETLRGSRIVAVAAQRSRRVTVTVGASTVHLKPGQQLTATVALNAAGRSLLAHEHRLAVQLTVSGTVVGALRAALKSATVTLSAAAKTSSHRRR